MDEGIVYNIENVDKALLQTFLNWMDQNNISYLYSDDNNELEIYDEFSIKKDAYSKYKEYLNKLNLQKIWEDTFSSGASDITSLGNVNGQGPVRMAAQSMGHGSEFSGSGDRWDNSSIHRRKKVKNYDDVVDNNDDEDNDNEDDKKYKRHKKQNNLNKMEKNEFLTYSQFVNESKIVAKRKYTEKYPQKHAYTGSVVRSKVLEFLATEGNVTASKLKEYFSLLDEEVGKRPNSSWLINNKQYIRSKFDKELGEKIYFLSDKGQRLHKRYKDFEAKNLSLDNEDIERIDAEFEKEDAAEDNSQK
jgi:hypothetical protein